MGCGYSSPTPASNPPVGAALPGGSMSPCSARWPAPWGIARRLTSAGRRGWWKPSLTACFKLGSRQIRFEPNDSGQPAAFDQETFP